MKKLLAIVMAVAMVLSMSTFAMAEEAATNPWDVTVASIENVAEGVKVTFNISGNISAHEVRIYYTNASVVKNEWEEPMGAYNADTKGVMEAAVVNDVADAGYFVFTGAGTSKRLEQFNGELGYVIFDKAATLTVKDADGLGTSVSDFVAEVATPAPTAVPTTAPTTAPTAVAPTQDPNANGGNGGTGNQGGNNDNGNKATDAPKVTPTAAPNGKVNAGKTADVAPVATMITLVVVAGVAIVSLKKKATN